MFYDNWVARDINGTALENAPFENIFHHKPSNARFNHHLPIQVQSCWNGIAILDPAPLYEPPPVRFRMAKITEGECSASECSLICNDYWEAGYGRILMVPRVKLAYDRVSISVTHLFLSLLKGCLRGFSTLFIPHVETSRPYGLTSALADFQMIHGRTRRTGRGSAHTIGYSLRKNTNPSTFVLDQKTVRCSFLYCHLTSILTFFHGKYGAGAGTVLVISKGRMLIPSGSACQISLSERTLSSLDTTGVSRYDNPPSWALN